MWDCSAYLMLKHCRYLSFATETQRARPAPPGARAGLVDHLLTLVTGRHREIEAFLA